MSYIDQRYKENDYGICVYLLFLLHSLEKFKFWSRVHANVRVWRAACWRCEGKLIQWIRHIWLTYTAANQIDIMAGTVWNLWSSPRSTTTQATSYSAEYTRSSPLGVWILQGWGLGCQCQCLTTITIKRTFSPLWVFENESVTLDPSQAVSQWWKINGKHNSAVGVMFKVRFLVCVRYNS